jgi:hypothetical protein
MGDTPDMRMIVPAAAITLGLASVSALAQAPDVGRMLQGLTTGNQNQDQALREAYERGYRNGQQDAARDSRRLNDRRSDSRDDYRPPSSQPYERGASDRN